jgi:hypothetical protein
MEQITFQTPLELDNGMIKYKLRNGRFVLLFNNEECGFFNTLTDGERLRIMTTQICSRRNLWFFDVLMKIRIECGLSDELTLETLKYFIGNEINRIN